jgi:hypothetical protein
MQQCVCWPNTAHPSVSDISFSRDLQSLAPSDMSPWVQHGMSTCHHSGAEAGQMWRHAARQGRPVMRTSFMRATYLCTCLQRDTSRWNSSAPPLAAGAARSLERGSRLSLDLHCTRCVPQNESAMGIVHSSCNVCSHSKQARFDAKPFCHATWRVQAPVPVGIPHALASSATLSRAISPVPVPVIRFSTVAVSLPIAVAGAPPVVRLPIWIAVSVLVPGRQASLLPAIPVSLVTPGMQLLVWTAPPAILDIASNLPSRRLLS